MPARSFFAGCLLACLWFLPGAAGASDEPSVDSRFEAFCKDWLHQKNDFAAKKMQYRKVDSGFIAEYDGYSDTFSTKVKVSDPVKKVYVGILSYNEVKLQHQGHTREAAKIGPFDVLSQSPVKEIFMYRNGKWQD